MIPDKQVDIGGRQGSPDIRFEIMTEDGLFGIASGRSLRRAVSEDMPKVACTRPEQNASATTLIHPS